MKRTAGLAALVTVLALAGCSGNAVTASTPTAASNTVSEACAESLQALADVEPADFDAEDVAVVASTTACTTVAEYLKGFHENPESWAYVPDAFDKGLLTDDVDEGVVISACLVDGTTPMCDDAAKLGYDFVPGD